MFCIVVSTISATTDTHAKYRYISFMLTSSTLCHSITGLFLMFEVKSSKNDGAYVYFMSFCDVDGPQTVVVVVVHVRKVGARNHAACATDN